MTRVWVWVGLALVPTVAYAWLVAASAAYCRLAIDWTATDHPSKWALFRFPFTQIIDVILAWSANGTMYWWFKVAAVVAVLGPTLVLAALVVIAFRLRRGQRPIYGDSQFADRNAIRNGGIRLRRRA